MIYQVFLTDGAVRDLEGLYDYIESHEAPEKADYVLDQIEDVFSSLSENRGTRSLSDGAFGGRPA